MLSTNPVTANLIKARELIADEKNWCQLAYEVDGRICAVGALSKVAWGQDYDITIWPLIIAAREQHCDFPEHVNDFLGHAAVMKMFDRAIELSLQG